MKGDIFICSLLETSDFTVEKGHAAEIVDSENILF